MSTGMPRPLSVTRTPPSASSTTSTWSACPARASSTELSTTSHTRWCRPLAEVEPMYMLGRLRTASRPSRTVIELPVYSPFRGALGDGLLGALLVVLAGLATGAYLSRRRFGARSLHSRHKAGADVARFSRATPPRGCRCRSSRGEGQNGARLGLISLLSHFRPTWQGHPRATSVD